MCNLAIEIKDLGKMYRLYKKQTDKILDVFGLNAFKKNYYQEFWALRNLSLEVRKGERIGIIGRNGAGKSTLLKTIIGNISPTEGHMTVNGSIQALMELGTGFHPEFTGRENIRASLAYQGFTHKQIREKEEEIIDFAELDDFIDQPVKTYSAGMYARLAFSTATAIEPSILIIDEVLGAGDAYFAGKCVERMRKLTDASGATVLFVSHDLNSVLQLCDRVIWIDRGKVRAQGDPIEVIKQYNAMIRQQEEIRLRARDLKILKRNAILLDQIDDIFQPMLFRFIGESGESPKGENNVYDIRLKYNDMEIGCIDVGGPMDNTEEQQNFIIDTKGYMDWSKPQKGNKGMYRQFTDMKGLYKHAPFQFSIPKDLIDKALSIEIDADLDDKIELQIYWKNNYIRIGELTPKKTNTYNFKYNLNEIDLIDLIDEEERITDNEDNVVISDRDSVPLDQYQELVNSIEPIEIVNNNALAESTISNYGNMQVKIKSVKMFNHEGKEGKIFETEKPMTVEVQYDSSVELINPVFVFCVYFTDGRCATQWIADSNVYNIPLLPQKGTFTFTIDKLFLGKGVYIASVGIFKHLARGNYEAESYHVIDRSIHFEIVQPIDDALEKGVCVQPFAVSVKG